jgi:hypothetical protein
MIAEYKSRTRTKGTGKEPEDERYWPGKGMFRGTRVRDIPSSIEHVCRFKDATTV